MHAKNSYSIFRATKKFFFSAFNDNNHHSRTNIFVCVVPFKRCSCLLFALDCALTICKRARGCKIAIAIATMTINQKWTLYFYTLYKCRIENILWFVRCSNENNNIIIIRLSFCYLQSRSVADYERNIEGENLFYFLYTTFNGLGLCTVHIPYYDDAISHYRRSWIYCHRYLDMPSGVKFSLSSIFIENSIEKKCIEWS